MDQLAETKLRLGVRLAIDWGKARIGVARCDAQCLLCFPVETISTNKKAIGRIAELVEQYEPLEVILGLPIDLRGELGPAAQTMLANANRIAKAIHPVPLCLADERLSTAQAARKIEHTGLDTRNRRSIIDQQAAVEILENCLATEAKTGNRPKIVVVDKLDADSAS